MIGSWFMSFNSLQSINLLYRAHLRFPCDKQNNEIAINRCQSVEVTYLFTLICKINDIRARTQSFRLQYVAQRHVT